MAHHHHGDDEHDWAGQLEMLERDGELALPWVEQAARWLLDQPSGAPVRRVVDVGAGPGHATCLFARMLPDATVTALDATRPFLDRVRERAASLGISERITTHEGDLDGDLGAVAPADLIWASRVLHHTTDPVGSLRNLRDALVPGGLLAVAEGGLPMRVLPGGYGVARSASFVNRLDAAVDEALEEQWAMADSATRGAGDWPVMMTEAGLAPAESRTFVLEHRAPVTAQVREHVVDRFASARERIADRLTTEDARALDRLLDERDTASLAQRQDLFLLTAHTVHTARRLG